jgi:pyruvate dehydrogenase E1 component
MPAMPAGDGVKAGILRGMYKFADAPGKDQCRHRAQLLGSGSIMNEVIKAQAVLAEKYGVAADLWSVTSYKELRTDGLAAERWNMLHPGAAPRVPWVTQCLGNAEGVVVAASDYVKMLPDGIAAWVPGGITSLGTDGFGRSESREALRDFFEVDHRYVVLATLSALARQGRISADAVRAAMGDLNISEDKADPWVS